MTKPCTLLACFSDEVQKTIRAIAKNPGWTPKNIKTITITGRTEKVQGWINLLLEKHIIIESSPNFKFYEPFFKLWLLRKRPIDLDKEAAIASMSRKV